MVLRPLGKRPPLPLPSPERRPDRRGLAWSLLTLAVLLRMLWDASPRLMVLALPFAAFTFSTLQNANLLNGFGMGQLLGTFAVVLSLFLLTDPRGGRGRFALALAAAVAAFVSHGATLALVPAGLVAVLFTGPRRSRGRVGLWCLVSSVGLALGAIGGRNVQMVVAWRRVPPFAVARAHCRRRAGRRSGRGPAPK